MSGLCAVNEDNESCFYEEIHRDNDKFCYEYRSKRLVLFCFLIDPKNTDDMILKVEYHRSINENDVADVNHNL